MNSTAITVLVQNKSFITTKDVLLLSGFFRDVMKLDPDATIISVPRLSKKLFKHVLCYLIDTEYPYPKKYEHELTFYDINYDENSLYESYKTIVTKLNELYDSQQKISEGLNGIKCELDLITVILFQYEKPFRFLILK